MVRWQRDPRFAEPDAARPSVARDRVEARAGARVVHGAGSRRAGSARGTPVLEVRAADACSWPRRRGDELADGAEPTSRGAIGAALPRDVALALEGAALG